MSAWNWVQALALPAAFEVWADTRGVKDLTCIVVLVMYVLLAWGLMRFLTAEVSSKEGNAVEQLSFGWEQVRDHPLFGDIQPHVLEAFWCFHQANPLVWQLFHQFTEEVRTAGKRHYGVAAIFERIRWHMNIDTPNQYAAEFKLNNNYRSCYSRLAMIKDPSLKGFFETRATQVNVEAI